MIIDAELELSTDQDLSSGTGTGVLSENVYDLGVGRNIGVGKQQLYVVVIVKTALEGAGDTLDVELVSDSVETLDDSLTVHQVLMTLPALTAAEVVVQRAIPIASKAAPYERFLGLRYFARGTAALTAGVVDAFITTDPDAYKAYADNVTIN